MDFESLPIFVGRFRSQLQAGPRVMFWSRRALNFGFQEEPGYGSHQQFLSGRGIKAETTEMPRQGVDHPQIGSAARESRFLKIGKIHKVQDQVFQLRCSCGQAECGSTAFAVQESWDATAVSFHADRNPTAAKRCELNLVILLAGKSRCTNHIE